MGALWSNKRKQIRNNYNLILIIIIYFIQGNVALLKPTSQSSTYPKLHISSNAVDGVTNTHHTYCTHTIETTNNPWWRVDLGREEPVAEVSILNRGDCCPERLNGAEIRVGKWSSWYLFVEDRIAVVITHLWHLNGE